MSIKDRGFGSASKTRRRELSKKGGTSAHAQGKAHEWTSEEAKAATAKGVERRKLRQANIAALFLIKAGFAVEDLHRLQLSLDEYLYYGGAKSSAARIDELKGRIVTHKIVDELIEEDKREDLIGQIWDKLDRLEELKVKIG